MKQTIFYLLILFSFGAFSQWSNNTTINTTVAMATKSQSNVHSVSDSKGGIIMTWDDNRNSLTTADDIYAQRFSASGMRKWILYGTSICSALGVQKSPSIVESDNGSAIITWEDGRAGNDDIYAQKIDSSGNILWALDGIAVCSKTTTQKNPKIVSDAAGGAIIVWEDSLSFYWDVYAQRISSSGALLWPTGGVAVCAAPNTQANPKLDIDGLGGAIFTWQDKRNNIDYDIYAQRVNALGTAQWTVNGVLICNAINTQSNPRIEPDGLNGAVIGWVDKRNGTDYNVYSQRINSSGNVQWTSNGLSICSAINNQSALDMKYIGSSGIIFSWKDDRVNSNAIYSQLVSLSGTPQLVSDGIKISNALKSINPNVVSDGNGGAIIAWQDSVGIEWNISSQKLNSTGAIQWANGGVVVSDATDNQINVSQVSDGNGGAIYAWDDHRNTVDYDIYAHHLYSNGSSVVGIHELTASQTFESICFPNPINSTSVIQIKNNEMLNEVPSIKIYDAYGHLIKTDHFNSHQYLLNIEYFEAGIYFYFLHLKDGTSISKGSFISIK